jgi:hypothetical protein
MNPFASLSPVKDSQCSLWSLSVQFLTALLASPIEMAVSWFRPYKRTFGSQFCELVGHCFTNNTLVTRYQYQFISVTFGQLHSRIES